jgi:hypothetical protein
MHAGGLLIIDHRNYDAILDTGKAPAKNLYYQGASRVLETSRALFVGTRWAIMQAYVFVCSTQVIASSRSRPPFFK